MHFQTSVFSIYKGCDVNKRNIFQNRVYHRIYFRLSVKAGMRNQGTEWGEWWKCKKSRWECRECGESGWECRECGESGWEWWECGVSRSEWWESGANAGNQGGNDGNQGGSEGNKGWNLRIGAELMNYNCGEGQKIRNCVFLLQKLLQRQSSIVVLQKRCSAKTQQIYWRSPMQKCDVK